MALGHAHRLVPEATFLDQDPVDDGALIERALEALATFSPGVSGSTQAADGAFGVFEVQIDGLERLWGEEEMLVELVGVALAPILPGRPRAGIAGTRFAAALAALIGPESERTIGRLGRPPAKRSVLSVRPVPPGADAAFLAPLPAATLTRDLQARARLARFGLRTIGSVAALPRSALVARFGPEGERLHARANGRETDPFRPRRAPERLHLALPVEPAVAELEPLRFLLHRLAGALSDQLLARGAAADLAILRLVLDRSFAPSDVPAGLVYEQRMPEPTAQAEAIERLLFVRLERELPPAAVARLELELAQVRPAAGQQLALFVPQAARIGRLNWQLTRLALGFGAGHVGRVELADSEAPLAEDRWRWLPVGIGDLQPAGRPTMESSSPAVHTTSDARRGATSPPDS